MASSSQVRQETLIRQEVLSLLIFMLVSSDTNLVVFIVTEEFSLGILVSKSWTTSVSQGMDILWT